MEEEAIEELQTAWNWMQKQVVDPVNGVGNRVGYANRRPIAYVTIEEMRRQILDNVYGVNQNEEEEHNDEDMLAAVLQYEHSQRLQEEYDVSPEVAVAIVRTAELVSQPALLRQLSQNLVNICFFF